MKKILLSIVISFIGTFVSSAYPTKIPLGKELVLNALAIAQKGEIVVYGEGMTEQVNLDFTFSPVNSTSELSDVIKRYNPRVSLNDPRKRVWTQAYLRDDKGNNVLSANSSFMMAVRRNNVGRKIYVVPNDAGSLYFQLVDQKIAVDGAQSALMISVDGNLFQLEVKDGVVTVPSFIASNPDYWPNLQITFPYNTVVQYDKDGNGVLGTLANVRPEYVGVENIRTQELTNGYYLKSVHSPEYGWSPLIEIKNTQKQNLTLDIRTNSWARPTYVRACTLDQIRSGTLPAWTPYNLEGNDEWIETINLPVEAGTYYIQVEWPTYAEVQAGSEKG